MRSFKLSIILLAIFLSGCTSFNGLRTPRYDGTPVEPDEEAIQAYQRSREITDDEKEFYIRYPFSADIYAESVDYTNTAPILLGEGLYEIGEDIPAGRASLLGNESVFTSENTEIHVGNFIIRDAEGVIYFENLFHSDYGQLIAQVDLIEGHTIEIVGDNPEITVFYTENFPENRYVLMDPPELLVNLDRLQETQPLVKEGDVISLTAGIFEIGTHLDAGTYEIQTVSAPHNTELFHFKKEDELAVYELIQTNEDTPEHEAPRIELATGDKIYPNLVRLLELVKVE